MEIIPYNEWYVKDGVFDQQRVLNGWLQKLREAQSRGYEGLRLTGNTFWLEKKDWNDFTSMRTLSTIHSGITRLLRFAPIRLRDAAL